jgi:hypothetical protein
MFIRPNNKRGNLLIGTIYTVYTHGIFLTLIGEVYRGHLLTGRKCLQTQLHRLVSAEKKGNGWEEKRHQSLR